MHRCLRMPAPARPDEPALAAWLASEAVVRADGAVLSWDNPAHPGYPYPEMAALWLARAALRRRQGLPAGAVAAVRDRLAADLRAGQGAGRDGRAYLFDTALAIHALAWVRQQFRELPATPDGAPGAWRDAVARFLAADRPVLEAGDSPRKAGDRPRSPRWSERWAPHLLRAAAFLAATAARTGDGAWRDLAAEVRRRARREAPSGYTHARAYAAEGEVLWRAWGGAPGDLDPVAEARALAALQRDDGGLPAFTDGTGPSRADATAQAVRLWCLEGPDGHRDARARGLAFLAAHQDPGGAVAYEPGSEDRNAWATLFAEQACAWDRDGADPRDLL